MITMIMIKQIVRSLPGQSNTNTQSNNKNINSPRQKEQKEVSLVVLEAWAV